MSIMKERKKKSRAHSIGLEDYQSSLELLCKSQDYAPPPWLINMQRYGPPPSFPYLKIKGLNYNDGMQFGFLNK